MILTDVPVIWSFHRWRHRECLVSWTQSSCHIPLNSFEKRKTSVKPLNSLPFLLWVNKAIRFSLEHRNTIFCPSLRNSESTKASLLPLIQQQNLTSPQLQEAIYSFYSLSRQFIDFTANRYLIMRAVLDPTGEIMRHEVCAHVTSKPMQKTWILISGFKEFQLVILFSQPQPCESESHSVTSNSAIPWTVASQVLLSVELSRQEYWSRLPFPSPGNLPNPGIDPRSPAL